MKMLDVTSLAKALKVTETLTILSLPCNLLDDNTVRILASGLQGNATITALDLSHNKIADRGVKARAPSPARDERPPAPPPPPALPVPPLPSGAPASPPRPPCTSLLRRPSPSSSTSAP
jgi:hypothetical protein